MKTAGSIFLVRHGETVENRQRILQGHLPGTLTDEGVAQMERTAEALAEREVAACPIMVSDLQRTMLSADIIARRLGMTTIVPVRELRERDWGPYTGMPISEARERFCRDGVWTLPGAETEDEIAERARRALEMIRPHALETGVVVVTHGLFARYLVAAHFGCNFREVTPLVNAEVRVLKV